MKLILTRVFVLCELLWPVGFFLYFSYMFTFLFSMKKDFKFKDIFEKGTISLINFEEFIDPKKIKLVTYMGSRKSRGQTP